VPVIVPLSVAPLIPYSMELICFAFAASAVKVNWIVSLCPVAFAVTPAGASGGAAAWMAGLDSAECADSPAWFVAVTSYSYQELLLLTVTGNDLGGDRSTAERSAA